VYGVWTYLMALLAISVRPELHDLSLNIIRRHEAIEMGRGKTIVVRILYFATSQFNLACTEMFIMLHDQACTFALVSSDIYLHYICTIVHLMAS
jgi:hypothetical protein